MLEPDLLPHEPAPVVPVQALEVDARGWMVAIVLMVLVGIWALRAPPAPGVPGRVASSQGEPWMVDALPGIGARTRERYWRVVQDGDVSALPERARMIARQVFTWPDAPRRSGLPVAQ